MFVSCNGGASGLRPFAAWPARRTLFAAFTDQESPFLWNAIGADSTPRNLPTRPDSAAMGPPAPPLAMPAMASR